MFVDGAGVAACFLLAAPIAEDLGIDTAHSAWILTAYSLAFAGTLLLAGRLTDLYSPKMLFAAGFMGLGILNLVISFMQDQYAFFVLRAMSALLAVLTVPSSVNMIVQMYPNPHEQTKKLAVFALAGALSTTIGPILAGAFVPASWRWFFRFICIVAVPISVLSFFLLPDTKSVASETKSTEKWRRMDFVGVFLILAILILFILAFTQAELDGWGSAMFIAPLVISLVLLPVFIVWELKRPEGCALLPHDIWSFPNIFPLILHTTAVYGWFSCFQLRMSTYFQEVLGDSALMTGVKFLPLGITGIVMGSLIQYMPWLITRPRFVMPVASALACAGSLILAFSNGGKGVDYWKYIFTAEIVGTLGAMVCFVGMNTGLIQAFPLEFAGVGGSFANVVFQIGGVVALAIQTGLLSTGDGTIQDWKGTQNSYFFTSAYIMFTGTVFCLWYRQDKMPVHAAPSAA